MTDDPELTGRVIMLGRAMRGRLRFEQEAVTTDAQLARGVGSALDAEA